MNKPSEARAWKRERDRFVALAFCRADLLFELDEDHTILFAAGVTPVLMGSTPEKLVGSSFMDFIGERHRAYARDLMSAGGKHGRIDDVVLDLLGPKGRTVPVAIAAYRVPDFDNHFFVALKVEPVGVKHVSEDTLNRQQSSGLLDGESFTTAATERIQAYNRSGGEGQVTYVRLKNLQQVTADLGASEKKALMGSIARVLSKHSLGGNTAGQIDGENFAYVHAQDVDAEKVNIEVEETAGQFLKGEDGLETRSATLAADGAGLSEDQVAKALVHAMQQFCSGNGKLAAGRLSDSLEDMMADTVETVRYIKDISSRRNFDLVFMPICDLNLGKVHHFEALSRFREMERAKTTFQIITLAEQLDLIPEFDFAVLQQTMEVVKRTRQRGAMPSIAINVSSLSLFNDTFTQRLHAVLDGGTDLQRRIMFELTESADVGDLDRLNKVIQSIRDKGFTFCLDDFGAGAASFDYLNALDVDVVKFDGPVVRRACSSRKGHDMLANMAKLCKGAHVHTVAEMVETAEMANQLYSCGIDYGQGWHFGKPNADPLAFEKMFVGNDGGSGSLPKAFR